MPTTGLSWATSEEEIKPLFEDACQLFSSARSALSAFEIPWQTASSRIWAAGPTQWALVTLHPLRQQLLLIDHLGGDEYGVNVMARPEQWLPGAATEALLDLVPKLGREQVEWKADRWHLPFGTPATWLWRPVGQAELDLIAAAGWRAFPPRLPGQPIFYPVLSEEYATRISRDWNTKDPASGHVGYVLTFALYDRYAARFEPKRVGGAGIDELWIPAEEIDLLNANLVGPIRLVAEHRP